MLGEIFIEGYFEFCQTSFSMGLAIVESLSKDSLRPFIVGEAFGRGLVNFYSSVFFYESSNC